MQSSPPRTPLSPWQVLLTGILALTGFELLGIFAAAELGGFATFFIMLFGGAIAAGIASRWLRAWAGVVFCIAFFVVVILGFGNTARPVWQSITGVAWTTPGAVPVERAHEYDASIFEFSNGSVRPTLLGASVRTGFVTTRTGGTGHPANTLYVVAPLVSESWSAQDEITTWVVCSDTWNPQETASDTWKCQQDWNKDFRVGVRVEQSTVPEVQEAVADAVATHGLRSHPAALFVSWTEDLTSAQSTSHDFGFFILALGHSIYIVAVLWNWRKIREA